MNKLINLLEETLSRAYECENTFWADSDFNDFEIRYREEENYSGYHQIEPCVLISSFEKALKENNELFFVMFDGYLYSSGSKDWCNGLSELCVAEWETAYEAGLDFLSFHDIIEYTPINKPEFLIYALENTSCLQNSNHAQDISTSLQLLDKKWTGHVDLEQLKKSLFSVLSLYPEKIKECSIEEKEKIARNLKTLYPDNYQDFLSFIPGIIQKKESQQDIFNVNSVATASLKINLDTIYQKYDNILTFASLKEMLTHCSDCITRLKPDNVEKLIVDYKDNEYFNLILESRDEEKPNTRIVQNILLELFGTCNSLYEGNAQLSSYSREQWDKITLNAMLNEKLESKPQIKHKKI